MHLIAGITKRGLLLVLSVNADVSSRFERAGKNRVIFCQHGRYLISVA